MAILLRDLAAWAFSHERGSTTTALCAALAVIIAGLVSSAEEGWTWAGAALIVSAGIYSIWREGQRRKEPE